MKKSEGGRECRKRECSMSDYIFGIYACGQSLESGMIRLPNIYSKEQVLYTCSSAYTRHENASFNVLKCMYIFSNS